MTDRGRIYITFGPPDQIWLDRAPGVGSEEKWQYRYLEGIGADVDLDFVNARTSGEFRLALSPEERERLFESQDTGLGEMTDHAWLRTFHEENFPGVPAGFKALQAIIVTRVNRRDFSVQYRTDEMPSTPDMSLVSIQLKVPLSEFLDQSNDSYAALRGLNLFCWIRDTKGDVVKILQDKIRPSDPGNVNSAKAYVFQRNVTLEPGLYDLAIAVGNPESHQISTIYTQLTVSGEKN